MLLAYGTIPHEWLNFSNSYMKWNAAKFIVHSGQKIGPIHWLNFDINKQALSDTGAVVIYAVMLTLNVILISKWQKRPIATDEMQQPAAVGRERVASKAFSGEGVSGSPAKIRQYQRNRAAIRFHPIETGSGVGRWLEEKSSHSRSLRQSDRGRWRP